MIPDEPFWPAPDMAVADLRRHLEELIVAATVDADGELDETARMLKLKRGCRR